MRPKKGCFLAIIMSLCLLPFSQELRGQDQVKVTATLSGDRVYVGGSVYFLAEISNASAQDVVIVDNARLLCGKDGQPLQVLSRDSGSHARGHVYHAEYLLRRGEKVTWPVLFFRVNPNVLWPEEPGLFRLAITVPYRVGASGNPKYVRSPDVTLEVIAPSGRDAEAWQGLGKAGLKSLLLWPSVEYFKALNEASQSALLRAADGYLADHKTGFYPDRLRLGLGILYFGMGTEAALEKAERLLQEVDQEGSEWQYVRREGYAAFLAAYALQHQDYQSAVPYVAATKKKESTEKALTIGESENCFRTIVADKLVPRKPYHIPAGQQRE